MEWQTDTLTDKDREREKEQTRVTAERERINFWYRLRDREGQTISDFEQWLNSIHCHCFRYSTYFLLIWLWPSPWLLAVTAVGMPRLGVVSDVVRLYCEFAMRRCSLKLWELKAFLQGRQTAKLYSLSIFVCIRLTFQYLTSAPYY